VPVNDNRFSIATEKLKQVEEVTGVPATDLQAALEDIARSIAQETSRQTYKEITEPQNRLAEADRYMETNFPEAIKFQDEITQFVKTTPEVGEMVGELWKLGKYKEAMRYSLSEWRNNMNAQTEHQLRVAEEVRKEEVAAAKVDAGLMTTNAQSARENKEQGVTQEELDKYAAMARAGYPTPLLRNTIGRMLPDSVFGPDA
jgi:hypothetical protein